LSEISQLVKKFKCNCKKSKCLKKYCECYANNEYCKGCDCNGCSNTTGYSIDNKDNTSQTSINENIICNCTKSNCLKNYCDCHKAGVRCKIECRCADCKNLQKSSNPKEFKMFFTRVCIENKHIQISQGKIIINNINPLFHITESAKRPTFILLNRKRKIRLTKNTQRMANKLNNRKIKFTTKIHSTVFNSSTNNNTNKSAFNSNIFKIDNTRKNFEISADNNIIFKE